MEAPVANIPTELEDRAEYAWESLLAIADAAGGDWPKLAREDAKVPSKEAAVSDGQQSEEIRLMVDIAAVHDGMPHVSFLSTRSC